ncbi:MAG TPA: UDP-N-acetylmuramoyl-L-alanine--D-glutamate ligase [Burkholderiales bacterium]|jgi:UDP-N-acetylmuramoylalanine--D-glutamate ligase|nr:UDP-N-acetylmuramoyl-L-alanine--D-glutamate ligase [Burkholderiales bacterium]
MREPPFQSLPRPQPTALAGKRVLVLGLGDTGLSVVRWVAAQGALARVADTRAVPPRAADLGAGVELVTGKFAPALLEGVDLLCISPGLSLEESVVREALARGVPVLGDIELFAWDVRSRSRASVLAITGTNGKTTVTALTAHLLRSAGVDCEAAGNIGPAALDALAKRQGAAPAAWVLELSSYQLETAWSLEPDAAALLNVTEDHLDRYAGIDEYAAAKARVFFGNGVQVLNRDDPRSMARMIPGRAATTFGLDVPAARADFGMDRGWLVRGADRILRVAELQIFGRHNAANALAACALAVCGGASIASLAAGLRTFRGLPHRLERVAVRRGVAWYDDSKGTNVGATIAALAGLDRKAVLIAGGEGKGQDFSALRPAVQAHATRVLLIGRDAALLERALAGTAVPLEHCASIEAAVRRAAESAATGEAVLLSPACASFDMFRDYQHRGDAFAAAVRALGT